MKFPIYRVEFDIYTGGDSVDPWAGCRQDMMLLEKFKDHDAACESLEQVVHNLAEMMGVANNVTAWDGFMVFDRMDTWCYHYESHYTYQRFAGEQTALNSFRGYILEHTNEVFDTNWRDWHVCECDVCKALNRTMILHVEKEKCPTCSSVF